MIPLRIVAPAFLSASNRAKTPRKAVYLDASIPALFTGANSKPAAPPMDSLPPPVPEVLEVDLPTPESESAPESELEHQSESGPEPEPAQEEQPVSTPPLTFSLAPSPEPLPPPAPVFANHGKIPESVGEVFGNPHKVDWTPAEIVQNTVKLNGVAGAVVALQEGLQVASSLPDGVKSDVVAAFLPQIFARLNQYAGEMRLGDVDDLLFTTHGAHCQIYRLGYVYFAVLGKPGESLPWHELRLVSEELARQTNK
jgi:predicted regulator of Ras-like GTPase activity (Roadblock/LC7/MglB family)